MFPQSGNEGFAAVQALLDRIQRDAARSVARTRPSVAGPGSAVPADRRTLSMQTQILVVHALIEAARLGPDSIAGQAMARRARALAERAERFRDKPSGDASPSAGGSLGQG